LTGEIKIEIEFKAA